MVHGQTPNTTDSGVRQLSAVVLNVIDVVKYFLYGILIFFGIFQGVRLVTAGKDAETVAKSAKENLIYTIVAIMLIFLADTAVNKIIFPEGGALFENQGDNIKQIYAAEAVKQIRAVYSIMAYVLGALALAVVIISGVGIAMSAGNEEGMKKHRNRILWSLAAVFITSVAEFVVKDIVFPANGSQAPNISKGLLLVKQVTNFASGFVTTISFVLLLYAGYLYVTAGVSESNTDKAKKAIIAAIVGILLSLGAFGLVSTFIKTESAPQTITPIGQKPPILQTK